MELLDPENRFSILRTPKATFALKLLRPVFQYRYSFPYETDVNERFIGTKKFAYGRMEAKEKLKKCFENLSTS